MGATGMPSRAGRVNCWRPPSTLDSLPCERNVVMKSSLLVRVILTWVFFVPMAFLNGAIREKWYRPLVGELRAHQISTALGSGAFFLWAFFMLKKTVAQLDRTKLLLIGVGQSDYAV